MHKWKLVVHGRPAGPTIGPRVTWEAHLGAGRRTPAAEPPKDNTKEREEDLQIHDWAWRDEDLQIHDWAWRDEDLQIRLGMYRHGARAAYMDMVPVGRCWCSHESAAWFKIARLLAETVAGVRVCCHADPESTA